MTNTFDRISLNSNPDGDGDRNSADIEAFVARGLVLHQASTHSWLVRSTDPLIGSRGLIACIDENSLGFEVMELGSGFQWTLFRSLAEIATYLGDKHVRQE